MDATYSTIDITDYYYRLLPHKLIAMTIDNLLPDGGHLEFYIFLVF